jgi:hypothetical protein
MARKKLNEIQQTHGKIETFRPTTLDQVWGDTGMNRYGTLDEKEYADKLADMNKADLQRECTRIGRVPVDDRERIIKILLAEFKQHISAYRAPHISIPPEKVPSKEVLKILSEGR